MKTLFLTAIAALCALSAISQQLTAIKLNEPDRKRGNPVMQALDERHSERNFADRNLSFQDLSDLLWAANGINRPDGRRTAATARNNQDIDLYVIMQQGAYIYDATAHELRPIAEGDHRPLVADVQVSIAGAPVCLLIVSDISRFKGLDVEMQKQLGAIDAGIVAQNIALFCSGCGLVTVPRVYMKKDDLKRVLKLTPTQIPMLNHPVGYTVE